MKVTDEKRVWRPILPPSLRSEAIDVAREVGTRLRHRALVDTAAEISATQTAFPNSAHWHPAGVAQGYAGLAIMYSYFDSCFPDEEWDVAGHEYLQAAMEAESDVAALPPGLFAGLSGLAFAAWCLSRGGSRYSRLSETLDEAISVAVEQLVAEVRSKQALGVQTFDLMAGLSGVAAYLTCRASERRVTATLRHVLTSLISLADSYSDVPAWFTPPELLDPELRRMYPSGNLNCGLAHGIPGPLAALSLARTNGIRIGGLDQAIRRMADWIVSNRADDSMGPNWPTAVPPPRGTDSLSVAPTRAGWCYGSPGVARSLWLAGRALGDRRYSGLALTAVHAVFKRSVAERRIGSPTFCHGIAGLLQITLRFANDTTQSALRGAAVAMYKQLIAEFEPNALVGFSSLDPPNRRVDRPGLLDGAAGVPMVLLACSMPEPPVWDRLFLLS